jgi:alanine racemase
VIVAAAPHNLRCWAEIDLGALRHNVSVVRDQVGARVRIMAIVKANAYGHGAPEVARAIGAMVQMFGVADVGEARRLRETVPAAKIFILGTALPEEREEIVRSGFVPTISSFIEAAAFGTLVRENKMQVHVDIDTGMGRIGIWEDDAAEEIGKIEAVPQLEIAGISTHLPSADDDENFTTQELAHFEKIIAKLRERSLRAPLIHSLNSAGIVRFSKSAHDMVRPGLLLYGSSPVPEFQKKLRPVMTLKTRVTLVRDLCAGRSVSYGRTFITSDAMRVATLAIGYADGYRRHLSNRGADVLVGGRRCPLLGRVTMDQIMADVSALPHVAPGDEAVLIGRQGNEEILASELAQKAGTIAWEIFTGIGERVERRIISD